MHYLLVLRSHGTQRVEEISCPHNLRVHDDFVDQMVCVCNELSLLRSENSVDLSLNLLRRKVLTTSLIFIESVWHLLSHSAQLRVRVELLKQNLQLILDAQDA